MVVAPTSSHAQAPPLGTAASFGVLAGSTVTNTPLSPTVINGDLGVSPGNTVTGFPAGTVTPPFTIHAGDAVAAQAQLDNITAYNVLSGRPIMTDLTGQNLGNRTLIAGVYGYNTSAVMTGTLTLDGQGNPNSVFIFNIGSTLTTASASNILLINGAQGAHVFFRVGSSATLGTTTSFAGDILALTSITLNTGATINCGAAWAQNGAVTLDNNVITICQAAAASASSVLPASASGNQRAVGGAIDAFVTGGGTLPNAFADLLIFSSPGQLSAAFTQLSGEAGTGAAQAATQAMNSFLSLVTNPFDNNRPFAESRGGNPTVVKTLGYAPESPQSPARAAFTSLDRAASAGVPDPRRWGVWAAGYGDQGNATGNPVAGSHDRTVRTFGYASGLDYRVTPYTVAGFALAGGSTNYGLSQNLGGGRSDMFQAAVYTSTQVDAAYVSAALAYAWHRVSTDRYLTLAGTDHLTASFSANNIAGRIEGGYRFAIPNVLGLPGRAGVTPYAAGQIQTFRTPSYSEGVVSGSPIFALAYNARTTTTTRTELGARFDWAIPIDHRTSLTLRTRAAWAHDRWSEPDIVALFQALPGSSFTVIGAAPASDLLLASAGAEIWSRNGFSVAAWFDGEFAEHSQKYTGTGRLRYTW